MGKTAIEWCDWTWNPWAGCARVSSGCTNCYAEQQAHRLEHKLGQEKYRFLTKPGGGWSNSVRFWPKALEGISRRQKSATIFVNSMSDVYHPAVRLEDMQRVWDKMIECDQHTFLILTKRPERMLDVAGKLPWPDHIWQGVTIESSAHAWRADLLREHPTAIRWISAEPLIDDLAPALEMTDIHWLIVGGETGRDPARVRRMMPEWARNLRDLCARTHPFQPAFFFKQWGNWSEMGIWRKKAPHGEGVDGLAHHFYPEDMNWA